MSDYETRFGGIARLFGQAGLERLRAAHVMIVGIGGVGTWSVEALSRSGVGRLTVVDMDDVCVTNVNRQIHALDVTIGHAKVSAIAARARQINPEIDCTEIAEFFTDANADRLLDTKPDYVIDAIDNVANKCLLIVKCREREIPLVTCGAAGGLQSGVRVKVEDLSRTSQDGLLRQVRKKLRRDHGFSRDPKRKFKIPAVYAPETPVYPWADGTVCDAKEEGTDLKLDCASGFGTATFVTGAFGFAAAEHVVREITAGD
ncbi:MAG: tRNA threonylcarbamoyladenosine dehydratase [Limisphaerales bacterium]